MKIAALQHHYEAFLDEKKITTLVERYAKKNIDLLLFPEYFGFEKHATVALFQTLSVRYKMYICSGSLITEGKNRSYFFSPSGNYGFQDKWHLTPYEIEVDKLIPGDSLQVFETTFGRVAICICYDIEFPLLVRSLVEMDARIILVPSYTRSVHGFYRVFLSARARALENQCYVIQSAMIGKTDTDMTYGAATVCSPVDMGFPEDGLLACGPRDTPGDVIVDIDLKQLDAIRMRGETRNYIDWNSKEYPKPVLTTL